MKRVNLGLLASSLMIAACGGGEGSFGGAGPVSDSFPITVANGEVTTRLSYEAALATGGFAELGSLPVGAAPTDGFAIADIAPAADDLVLDVIAMIPFGPVEELCLGEIADMVRNQTRLVTLPLLMMALRRHPKFAEYKTQ